MKPLLVGSRDYYAACLFRLEESRGHILNDQEYEALRLETLDELTSATRTPVFKTAAIIVAIAGCSAGLVSLFSTSPVALLAISICALAAGCSTAFSIQKTIRRKSTAERLEMLRSLQEHKLVTDVEFSKIHERLKSAA